MNTPGCICGSQHDSSQRRAFEASGAQSEALNARILHLTCVIVPNLVTPRSFRLRLHEVRHRSTATPRVSVCLSCFRVALISFVLPESFLTIDPNAGRHTMTLGFC